MLTGFQRCQERNHREPQGIRDADETQHGEVTLTLLNLADVCRTQARYSSKCRLQEPSLLPILTDGCSKELERHRRIAWLGEECDVMSHRRIPRLFGGESVTGCGRSKRGVDVSSCKETGGGNFQGIRKAEQRKHGNIAPALFDLADICARYPRSGGECPLGQPPLLPILAKSRAQELQGWIQVRSPFSHGVPIEKIT